MIGKEKNLSAIESNGMEWNGLNVNKLAQIFHMLCVLHNAKTKNYIVSLYIVLCVCVCVHYWTMRSAMFLFCFSLFYSIEEDIYEIGVIGPHRFQKFIDTVESE